MIATLPFPRSRRPARKLPLADQPPVLLSCQPTPVATHVTRMFAGDTFYSAIARVWGDGDEHRCRLCDSCSASNGVCLRAVNRFVSDDEARLYSTVGFRTEGPGMCELGFKVVGAEG